MAQTLAPSAPARQSVQPRDLAQGHDRCDACGVAAYVAVDFTGRELLFCAHHYSKHEPALLARGAVKTADERWKLERKNSTKGTEGPGGGN